jgi:hypothetical protein
LIAPTNFCRSWLRECDRSPIPRATDFLMIVQDSRGPQTGFRCLPRIGRSAKKKRRLKVLISLELSSGVSPHPRATASPLSREERAPWRASRRMAARPWFETPRKSAVLTMRFLCGSTRFIHPGRPDGSGLWPARWQAPAGVELANVAVGSIATMKSAANRAILLRSSGVGGAASSSGTAGDDPWTIPTAQSNEL